MLSMNYASAPCIKHPAPPDFPTPHAIQFNSHLVTSFQKNPAWPPHTRSGMAVEHREQGVTIRRRAHRSCGAQRAARAGAILDDKLLRECFGEAGYTIMNDVSARDLSRRPDWPRWGVDWFGPPRLVLQTFSRTDNLSTRSAGPSHPTAVRSVQIDARFHTRNPPPLRSTSRTRWQYAV